MYLFLILAAALILGVPVGISLGVASIGGILVGSGTYQLQLITQSMITALDSFPLMAVPFFILAGEIMGQGGISKRLLNTAEAFCGHYVGGLGAVSIVACMFFAAVSGSAPATTAAIGGIMIPSMIAKKYGDGYSAGLVASSGSIGVMIPPSIPAVIYSVSASVSISAMFMAGIIPGIMVGVGLCIYNWLHCRRHPEVIRSEKKYTVKEKCKIVWEAKWSLLMPVIILGGIYGGIFTPTESAAVAVVYGLIVSLFFYKDITFKDLYRIFAKSGLTTATVLIIMGTASTFGRLLNLEQIPTSVANAMMALTNNKYVILLLIILLLLVVGCFMETLAAIIILTPILLPVVSAVGVDPVHFGVIMIVGLAIGFITPPLGVDLFVASGIANISLEKISKAIVPPMLVMIGVLLLLAVFPDLSLFIPGLME
jgi:C4-dicarboxylate transporter DctM subunit